MIAMIAMIALSYEECGVRRFYSVSVCPFLSLVRVDQKFDPGPSLVGTTIADRFKESKSKSIIG
jgi:hypothetical protein